MFCISKLLSEFLKYRVSSETIVILVSVTLQEILHFACKQAVAVSNFKQL